MPLITIIFLSFQVYTFQRVEYSGGLFYGNELGEPTRTLLSFFASSIGGNYEDMICFFPIRTLTWATLYEKFLKVVEELHKIGLYTCLALADGHKTNVKFYTELCNGHLRASIQHPLEPEVPLYLMFDPVHLFKNFYHNFVGHK